MRLLLDLGYLLAALVASPWLAYRLVATGEWRRIPDRLGFGFETAAHRPVWLHGSSVGEISLLKPLVALLERELPDTPLLISAFTVTGDAAARKAYPGHRVVLFPFDLSFIVRRVLRLIDPRLIVIVESELWPNFLIAAGQRGVPVAVVNGRISPKSQRAHARTLLMPRVLRRMSLIAVQTEEHRRRFRSLGVPEHTLRVTGNMKYDLTRPPESSGSHALRAALAYTADDVVIIGGSLHEPEDESLLAAFATVRKRYPHACLVLVPRYPADTAAVEARILQRGYAPVRKSALDQGVRTAPGREAVLLVDTLGELQSLYAAADIAFVGGSLFFRGSNKGGHNLMEPAILGLPVLFGPHNVSFKETVEDLLDVGGGVLVRDHGELAGALDELVADSAARRAMGERARRIVLDRQGATRRNCELLLQLLGSRDERLPLTVFDSTMPTAAGNADSG